MAIPPSPVSSVLPAQQSILKGQRSLIGKNLQSHDRHRHRLQIPKIGVGE